MTLFAKYTNYTMKDLHKSGIYTITNIINNKMYVGLAGDFYHRFQYHFGEFIKNRHNNTHLQRAVNKYGIENFKFEILEECDKRFLFSQEHYWATMLNVHNKNYGYNDKPTHPDNRGTHSQEAKNKMTNNRTGIKFSKEAKKNMSKLQRARHNKAIIVFNEKSELIGEYDYYLDFIEEFNLPMNSVRKVLDKKSVGYKNFRILYKKDIEIDLSKNSIILIAKVTKDGEIINIYNTKVEASKAEKITDDSISKSCKYNIPTKNRYFKRINKIILQDKKLIYEC